MQGGYSGLDAMDRSSYLLHSKSSLSRVTLNTMPSSLTEDLATNQKNDIFQAKTQAEISLNYQKILLTYGKWNAEAYLKISEELNHQDEETQHPGMQCPSPDSSPVKCTDIKHSTARFKNKHAAPPKYKSIMEGCSRPHKVKQPGTAPIPEDPPEYPPERPYKKIFKNAKLKRKSRIDESLEDILTVISSKNMDSRQKKQIYDDESHEESSAPRQKQCELVKGGPNNYLIDVRRSKSEKDRKKVSFGSAINVCTDDIERYYVNKSMQAVLESNLEDHVQLMRASLKSHVTDISDTDLRETGYKELKGRCLNDFNSITEFQDIFDDSRWRKKFDLGKIEGSDDADSLDVSDIESSGSGSMCSGDSLGTELDYRPKPIPPSRIPCIAEVREMGDILFDRISVKWEKAIKKNFIDADMCPLFRHFSHAVRLRSTTPVFSDIMKMLEPYDDVYTKKYTPHGSRVMDKLEKINVAQKAKDVRARRRRSLESCQIRRGLGRRSPSPVHYVMEEPTKHRGKNQRHRLKRIMRETKYRDQEGLTNWTKKALTEEYVNLKPIIKTKTRQKTGPSTLNEPTAQSLRKTQSLSRSPRKITSMRSLRNFETSLFLRMPTSPGISLSPGVSKKTLSGSRSKLRMPI